MSAQQNPFAKFDTEKSVANTFDFGKAAGPMQSAGGVTVTDNMLASKQLGSILSKDSPLMVQARTRAQERAAARGLGNSSIAVGAGESAMIDAAMPLAQQDASTYYDAEKFNVGESNIFARDANSFGRSSAMARFNALTDAEQRDQDRGFNAWEGNANRTHQSNENLLDRTFRSSESEKDRTFQTGEREASQRFTSGENQLGRDFQSRENLFDRQFRTQERIAGQEYQSGENQADRQFRTQERIAGQEFQGGENKASREFQASQDALNRTHQEAMTKLAATLNEQAVAKNIPQQQVAAFTERMQTAIGNILADPNLTPEAKQVAIQNYQAYANQTMSWMAAFYKTETPNVTGGANFGATPGAGAAPAPGPAPVPSQQQAYNQSRGLPGDFDSEAYLAANPDVAAAVSRGQMTAEEHYLRWGKGEDWRAGTWVRRP